MLFTMPEKNPHVTFGDLYGNFTGPPTPSPIRKNLNKAGPHLLWKCGLVG